MTLFPNIQRLSKLGALTEQEASTILPGTVSHPHNHIYLAGVLCTNGIERLVLSSELWFSTQDDLNIIHPNPGRHLKIFSLIKFLETGVTQNLGYYLKFRVNPTFWVTQNLGHTWMWLVILRMDPKKMYFFHCLRAIILL